MTDRIPTNLRMLLILEEIGHMSGPVTPAELGRTLGLSKPTVHRLCATLLDQGFLVRDDRQKGLRPGRRMRLMASGVMNASSEHLARYQVLMTLAAEVGETVNFVSPEERGMTYQDRVETDWPFRIQLPVGTHVPFHCTASGKTYLASLQKAERARLVNVMHLERKTASTITDPDKLLAELAEISRQGYALDREEFIEGMTAIAVPVLDSAGRYAAAVAFHGPVQRIPVPKLLELKDRVIDASSRLTQVLFGP
ncbi:MAG: helix-turn-helix domain-containing protein [Rhodobacteraceae bacterium]|nr:helix-turn-helix domain-containing protein [Paracoccaceae bacterium]